MTFKQKNQNALATSKIEWGHDLGLWEMTSKIPNLQMEKKFLVVGGLTDSEINKLQNYYGLAIRRNTNMMI